MRARQKRAKQPLAPLGERQACSDLVKRASSFTAPPDFPGLSASHAPFCFSLVASWFLIHFPIGRLSHQLNSDRRPPEIESSARPSSFPGASASQSNDHPPECEQPAPSRLDCRRKGENARRLRRTKSTRPPACETLPARRAWSEIAQPFKQTLINGKSVPPLAPY